MLLVESNLAAWLAAHDGVPGVELHRDEDATWIVQPGGAWGNAVAAIRFSEQGAGRRIRQLVERYERHGRGAGFWVSRFATPANLGAQLAEWGFRCRKHFPGMHRDLGLSRPPLPVPEGVSITAVDDYDRFRSARRGHPVCGGPITTAIRRYRLEAAKTLNRREPRRVWEFVARAGGEAVGACTVFLSDDSAGIYDVAVYEDMRGRGIASALVDHSCRFAARRGYSSAVLIASGMGESVYRRTGFQEVCKMSYWYAALRSPS